MVRAAAKNHANVAVVTSPARYDEVLAALDTDAGLDDRSPARPRARGVRAHGRLRRADRLGAARSDGRGRAARPARRPVSVDADDRPREGRDAPLRREPAPAGRALPAARGHARGRPLRRRARAAPGQGAVVQQRPRRGGGVGARAGAARAGASSSSSTRTRAARPNARRSPTPGTAALEADPVSAFGGVVALTRPVDRADRRAPRLDLPRDRRRARLRRRRARGPRDQAEPARAPRRGARRRRRARRPARPDRLDPDRRRRGPRHDPGRRRRRPDHLDLRDPPRPDRRRSSSTSTSPGASSAA